MIAALKRFGNRPVLRGWLIYIFIVLLVRLFFSCLLFVLVFSPNLHSGLTGTEVPEVNWAAQTTGDYILMSVALLANGIGIFLSIWLLVLFFKESKRFPTAFFSVITAEFFLNLFLLIAFLLLKPETDASHLAPAAPIMALAIYQYLSTGKRPRTVFVK